MAARRFLHAVPITVLLALAAAGGQAVPLEGWSISGSNTVRLEHYDTDGDGGASPYAFDGQQAYDELNLRFSRRDSPWSLWRGEVNGLVNGSDYRSQENGIVPERLNLTREQGDAALPYRAEAGDFLGFFSYRSLQRSLKGAQLEVQPGGGGNWRQSVQLLAGADQRSWKELDAEDNFSLGASWIAQHRSLGIFGLNYVKNYRQADPAAGTIKRVQSVTTAVAMVERNLGRFPFLLEGEVARFSGDHDGTAGAASGQNRGDNGYFAQMSGFRNMPFSYRLRFEHYGRDFRPAGSVVTPDRRSGEAHAGYRFDSGTRIRGRLQVFKDNYESANTTETRTQGATVSGPLPWLPIGGASTYMDIFSQKVTDEVGSVDRDTDTVNVNLSAPLAGSLNGRAGYFYQDTDDNLSGTSVETHQATMALDVPVAFYGVTGTLSPGVAYRNINGGSAEGDELFPTLALGLARGPHSVAFDLGYNVQERDLAASADIDTLSLGFSYRYTRRSDVLGLELNSFDRDIDTGTDTQAWRISLNWTHYFDKPARRVARSVRTPGAPAAAPPPAPGTPLELSELAPGTPMSEAVARLQSAGISGGTRVGADTLVYNAVVLDAIDQRQRVVLTSAADELERSALIVDFTDVGNTDSALQTFERVRRVLIDRYGPPTTFFERGEFSPSLSEELNSGRLIRVMEWEFTTGVLRFGLPRRLDRQVRMELQFAERFRAPQSTLWSIERVR